MALIIFFCLLCIGVPMAFVLGLTTVLFIFSIGNTNMLLSMPSKMFNGMENFGLVAIPMFILLGEVMNSGGITQRLIRFSQIVFGQVRGGLAYVNVAANVFISSIIGSANAQSAIMCQTMVPAMEKVGYKKEFSSALTTASSILGPLIPPSTPFIIYGVTAGVSISDLFLAGIMPGLLFAVVFSLIIYYVARKNNFPKEDHFSWHEAIKATLYVMPALAIPILVIVGMTTGMFTATESAAIAVFIALIVGFFLYKDLKFKDLGGILIRTVVTTSTVTFLLATSNIFGWVLNYQRIPQVVAQTFLQIAENPVVFLLLVNLLLLIIGMFIEGVAGLILLIPILLPIATQYGVDPVQFGVIMTTNLTIGLMMPPVGTVLYIVTSITKISFQSLVKSLFPFLIISILVLLVITYVPWFSLGIPQLFSQG